MTKKQMNARLQQCITLGLTWNEEAQSYVKDDINIGIVEVKTMDEGEWGSLIGKIEKEIEARKNIPFTEAEHIEEPKQPVQETKAIDLFKKKELAAFENNPLVVAIAEFEKKYKGLTFKGLEDKTGIEAVKAAKKTVQKTRTFVTKHEEQLKAPYLSHLNEIRAVSKKFQAMIEPIETPLDAELDRLKELETAEEKRKEAEEAKELNLRVDLLKSEGMTFDGSFYVIGDTISMDVATIKAMPLPDFETFTGKVKKEKERLDNLEVERVKAMKADRLQVRGGMLKTLGYSEDESGNNYIVHGSDLFPIVGVSCITDEEDGAFMAMFNNISRRVTEAKDKAKEEADRKAKERTVSLRSKLALAIGMERRDYLSMSKAPGFYFKNDFVEIELPIIQVETATDEEFDKVIEFNEKAITEAIEAAKQKEEEDAAAAKLSQERGQQLIALGMTRMPKESCFIFNLPDATTQCSVAYGELTGQSAETWEATMIDVRFTINKILVEQQDFEAKAKQEEADRQAAAAKAEATFTQRQYDLVNLKMVIVAGEFIIRNEYGFAVKISIDEVKAIDEDMWPSKLTEITGLVDNLKKHTEEQRKAEADKAEALKPEIQKVKEYLKSISNIVHNKPEIKDNALNDILADFMSEVSVALTQTFESLEEVEN